MLFAPSCNIWLTHEAVTSCFAAMAIFPYPGVWPWSAPTTCCEFFFLHTAGVLSRTQINSFMCHMPAVGPDCCVRGVSFHQNDHTHRSFVTHASSY